MGAMLLYMVTLGSSIGIFCILISIDENPKAICLDSKIAQKIHLKKKEFHFDICMCNSDFIIQRSICEYQNKVNYNKLIQIKI